MTVIDTSAAVDFLLDIGVAAEVAPLLERESSLAAPDLLVFEVLAVLRRHVARGKLGADRAAAAVEDLGDFPVELFPALPLSVPAWELRENLTAADALFVALAEQLGEPLCTKDSALARAARDQVGIQVMALDGG